MKVSGFIILTLVITTGMFSVYTGLKSYYSSDQYRSKEVVQLKSQVQKEKFLKLLAKHQLIDFQQGVAQVLPEVIKKSGSGENGYPLRTLASVVYDSSGDELRARMSLVMLKRLKKKFKEGLYSETLKEARKFLHSYPYSAEIVEVYYLKAESQFHMQLLDQCVQTVHHMIELFPDHELTGHALLRVGRIYEFQDRHEEAMAMYKLIMKSFPYKAIGKEASRSMASIRL